MRLAAVALMAVSALPAHETITTKLTWTREISRLVYHRCASCHRPGGSAPMAFFTYDETRPWAKAIQEEVSERRMPPWDAVKGFGPEFQHEASLTPEEIKLFNDWVEGGAPKGDDKYLPPLPARPTPKPPQRAPQLPARDTQLLVRDGTVLTRDCSVAGVRPTGLEAGGWLQATVELPDGAVEPLVWIRAFQAKRNRTYLLAEPLSLPRGTRILIEGHGQLVLFVR